MPDRPRKQRTRKQVNKKNAEITASMKKCITKCSGDGVSTFKKNLCIMKTSPTCPEYREYFTRSKACREQKCKNELEAKQSDESLLQSETRKALNECFKTKCSDLNLD
jgi:glutamyl-tRNA reductase